MLFLDLGSLLTQVGRVGGSTIKAKHLHPTQATATSHLIFVNHAQISNAITSRVVGKHGHPSFTHVPQSGAHGKVQAAQITGNDQCR